MDRIIMPDGIAKLPYFEQAEELFDNRLIVSAGEGEYRLAPGITWEHCQERLRARSFRPLEIWRRYQPSSDPFLDGVRDTTRRGMAHMAQLLALREQVLKLTEEFSRGVSILPVTRALEAVAKRHGLTFHAAVATAKTWPYPTQHSPRTERYDNGWDIVESSPGLLVRVWEDQNPSEDGWLWLTPDLALLTAKIHMHRSRVGHEIPNVEVLEQWLRAQLPSANWKEG